MLTGGGRRRRFGLRRFGAEDCLWRGEWLAEGRRRHLGAARPDICGRCGGGIIIRGGRRRRKVAVQPAKHCVRQSESSATAVVENSVLGIAEKLQQLDLLVMKI